MDQPACQPNSIRRFHQLQPQFLLLVLLLGGGEFAQAKVIYVNASSPTNPPPDGLTWSTAFVNVSDGLSAAVDGDQVWVAAGIYYGRVGLRAGVALYGGFAGTETNLDTRNWLGHPTILEGYANTTVVKVPAGATNSTRLDGFVIRNGSSSMGGGISCSAASPVIARNLIVGNQAFIAGGGIECSRDAARVRQNRIIANVVEGGNSYPLWAAPESSAPPRALPPSWATSSP